MVGIDLARGLALLGMFAVHVSLFGESGQSFPAWLSWILEQPSGRASVLFVTLAGVSLSLLQSRGAKSSAAGAVRRRGIMLVGGGLLLSQTVWPASILEHYGILFLIAPFLMRTSAKRLVALGGLGLIGGPVFQLLVSSSPISSRFSLVGVSAWLVETAESLLFAGTYPLVIWFGFFCVGLTIGRLDLSSRRTAVNLLAGGVAGVLLVAAGTTTFRAAGVEVPDQFGEFDSADFDSADFDSADFDSADFDGNVGPVGNLDDAAVQECLAVSPQDDTKYWSPGTCIDKKLGLFADESSGGDVGDPFGDTASKDPSVLLDTTGHSGQIGWTLQSQSIAMALLGMFLLLGTAAQRAMRPLALLGSMSLSAYLIHIVLVRDVFDRVTTGEGWTSFERLWLLLALQALLVLIASAVLTRWNRGPAEWLMKKLVRA